MENIISKMLPDVVRKKPSTKDRYKKSKLLNELECDYKKWFYSKKTIPENLQSDFKFKDDCANALTRSIMAYLTMNGHLAARINTQGNYSQKLGKYIKSGSTKGVADIISTVFGKSVYIEVKFGKDKQRKEQIEFENLVNESDGIYIIAKTYEQFINEFKERVYNENK